MSYTALYRKYRPTEFEDVTGQDPIVTTLKNQIKAGRVGHAYLFCGTRGTGKTTVAKIFARAVNCEHPADGNPCGQCASCRAIAAGSSMNVTEIDAASNNGVENIRQIREEVTYLPTEGKYRVYIIDEVHMLSIGAFNALLKTLEEPPPYVIFILATTEAQKIPVTILSRCQRFDFRRISGDEIAARLAKLARLEQVDAEEKALRFIAKKADGSMRDGLSLLDQCIAFYLGQTLTYDHVLEVLGTVDTEVFSRLLRALIARDVAAAIRILDELLAQGREPGQFVADFVWYLRNLLLLKSSGQTEELLDMSGESLALLKEEADLLDSDAVMRDIRIFSGLSSQIRYSSQKRILIELALIRLCRPEMETTTDALAERVAQLERQIAAGTAPQAQTPPAEAAPSGADAGGSKPPQTPEMPKAVPEDLRRIVRNWPSLLREFPGVTRNYLGMARLSLSEDNQLMLVFDDELACTYIENHREEISDRLSRGQGKEVELLIRHNDTGHSFEDSFVDLEKLIHMDIEIEDM